MAKYAVGKEPDNIKKRLKTLFDKLDSAYPNKVIVGLQNISLAIQRLTDKDLIEVDYSGAAELSVFGKLAKYITKSHCLLNSKYYRQQYDKSDETLYVKRREKI